MGEPLKIPALQEAARQVIDKRYVPSSDIKFIVPNRRGIVSEIDINKVEFQDYPGELRLYNDNKIDNKTKAAVLREYADELTEYGGEFIRQMLYARANKLDPPQEPIHPHEGCEGMVVQGIASRDKLVFSPGHDHRQFGIPREASKLPAFLCNGIRPGWVKDGDFVWFIERGEIDGPTFIDWPGREYEYFCVINPVEAQ